MRKLALAAKTVEPVQLNSAVTAISSSCASCPWCRAHPALIRASRVRGIAGLAVVATLKVQFARAITLGASIGDMLSKPSLRHAFCFPCLASRAACDGIGG